jgi:hypothetical protein
MLAIQPPGVDVAGLSNARKRFAELTPMFAALADGPLGVSEEDGEHQLSAENAKILKRLGLDAKYAGIKNESELLELKELEKIKAKHMTLGVDFTGCTSGAEAEARIKAAGKKIGRARGVN